MTVSFLGCTAHEGKSILNLTVNSLAASCRSWSLSLRPLLLQYYISLSICTIPTCCKCSQLERVTGEGRERMACANHNARFGILFLRQEPVRVIELQADTYKAILHV